MYKKLAQACDYYYSLCKKAHGLQRIAMPGDMMSTVLQTCNVDFPGLGGLIGAGKQGEVYDFGDRVVKIQIALDHADAQDRVNELNKLMTKDSSVYPKVYDAGVLCEINNPALRHGWAYYYVMEKLMPTSAATEIANIVRAKVNNRPIKPFMNSKHLDSALELYDRMEDSGTVHVDVNPGNVMRNSDGVLKIIDLDSVVVA